MYRLRARVAVVGLAGSRSAGRVKRRGLTTWFRTQGLGFRMTA